jgi:isoquinoline 1-oxidoreductase beta subunit
MSTQPDISRRKFLQTSSLFAGGLLIPFMVPAGVKRLGALAGTPEAGSAIAFAPNAYLGIAKDNTIHIILAHVEMGQGIWTTLPMLIADELDCDWNKIKVGHAPPDTPYLHTVYGLQITGGSSTTWSEFDRYRKAGATARSLLVSAAAQRFGVQPEDCRTADGVVYAGDKKATYGELAEAAAKQPPPAPDAVVLKQPSEWKYIGKGSKRLDTAEKINGQAKFGMDVQFPGLLTAVVARPPVFGATMKSFDASKAKAIPGVKQVVTVPSGIAVIADHFWAAKQGREALKIEWNIDPALAFDSAQQWAEYRKLAATKGISAAQKGDAAAALPKAGSTIEAEYLLPYLAHAPMEPLNCTVKLSKDKCEIWTGTQLPGNDQKVAAKILDFKPEQVEINTMFLGGGFGRRANFPSDFVSEAVQVAKASGKAVKTVWTREDDIRGGFYRPAFMHQVKIGLDANKMPIAWQHSIVGQSIMAGTPFESKDGLDGASVEGVNDSPYLSSIPDHSVELHSPKNKIPVLWWRSVGHTHTAFVMETLIDELAHAAGKDPVEYRRTLLAKHPRHLSALNLAVEKSGWGKPLPEGHFRGVAVHESFGTAVAHVAEISINKGAIKLHRITCAVDCGLAVNPDGVKAQMESGIIYGLTALLYGEVTVEKGRVKQRNFHDYRILRMNETPVIDVYIADSQEKMGGAGEPGVPPVAPAVVNAIFAATGKRIRKLPLSNESLG